jgi:hypothetical protein
MRIRPEKFVVFCGWAASGHSIVGAILDSHPNIVLPHEFNVAHAVTQGVNQQALFQQMMDHADGQNRNSVHDFNIDYKWAGKARELMVLGDKTGGLMSQAILNKNPRILDHIKDVVKVPLKVIVVTRHPADNISAMFVRCHRGNGKSFGFAAQRYATNLTAVEKVIEEEDTLVMRHEELLSSPVSEINVMLDWLEVPVDGEHMEACCKKLYDKPKLARNRINHNSMKADCINKVIRSSELLQCYDEVNWE